MRLFAACDGGCDGPCGAGWHRGVCIKGDGCTGGVAVPERLFLSSQPWQVPSRVCKVKKEGWPSAFEATEELDD